MSNCIVILGNSRAGKDTAAQYYVENHGYRRLHCIQDMKRWLCEHYGLLMDACDNDKGRKPSVSCKYTLQELQVKLWHFWKEVDNEFTYPYVYNKLVMGLRKGDYAVVGVREIHEVDAIINACRKTESNLYCIRVLRKESYEEVSDKELKKLYSMFGLHTVERLTIHNDYDLEYYYDCLRAFLSLVE